MKFGFLRQDEDSHNYLIPEELIDMFGEQLNNISIIEEYSDEWYDSIDKFENEFGGYRIDDISNLKILMEE